MSVSCTTCPKYKGTLLAEQRMQSRVAGSATSAKRRYAQAVPGRRKRCSGRRGFAVIACKDEAVCIVSDDDMLTTMRIVKGSQILSFEC